AAVQAAVGPGVSTAELNSVAEEVIRRHGATPSFLHYGGTDSRPGFPAAICASVNAELVHGIPRPDVLLKEGDIISVDVGAIFEGWHGDAAITFPVGKVTEKARRLLQVTENALQAGIAAARPGRRVSDISLAIQRAVERHHLGVVREYTGHGIGREMHEPVQVLNYHERGMDPGPLLQPGITLALEPMVTEGTWRTRVLRDGWTVTTADGKLSAHFEHTIAITEGEARVLTLP
ncbi:MAG: type I methionyl aminopeptidase, partial [Anaerolineales bacterium]|nr:type I methionyl aminopeptidase [Anaerolineales bacterium]